MRQEAWQVSEKSSENSEMYEAATVGGASALLQEMWPSGQVKARIRKAAQDLGWSFTRTQDLWYAQAHRIDGRESIRILQEKAKREAARDAAMNRRVEELANEHAKLTDSLARLEAMLSQVVSRLADSQPST